MYLVEQVSQVLRAHAERIENHWSRLIILGMSYQAMRVMSDELAQRNPFVLLTEHLPGAKRAMGPYTMVVAGMDFEKGSGFVLLVGTAVPNGETLLDSTCKVAHTAVNRLYW